MSKSRQTTIRTLSVSFSAGHKIDWHSHAWSQLVYATSGAMTVETQNGRWIVPARRAIWIPAGQSHRIEMHGRVFMQTVYVPKDMSRYGLGQCAAVNVSPLLHELILLVCERGIVKEDSAENRNLVQFFLFQLRKLSLSELAIQIPQDERGRLFAEKLMLNPGRMDFAKLSSEVGSSLRTMQRIFKTEVDMSLARWCRQVKMVHAIQLLANDRQVSSITMELGFENPSSFIYSFRQFFGVSPGKFLKQQSR